MRNWFTRKRAWREKAMAVVAVFAVGAATLGGGYAAYAGTATEVDAGKIGPGNIFAGPGLDVTGILNRGTVSFAPINVAGGAGWCINAGLDSAGKHSPAFIETGVTSTSTITSNEAARIGWLQQHYMGVAADGFSAAENNAAISYLVHMNFEEGNKGPVTGAARKAQIEAQMPQRIKDRAEDLWTIAGDSLGMTTATATVHHNGMHTAGYLDNIGVQISSNGAWVANIPFTMTISGPAVFDTNNNGVADLGETATYTGNTSTGPITVRWVSTGNGTATTQWTYNIPTWLVDKITYQGQFQDGIRGRIGDPATTPGNVLTFPVVKWFQPEVSTIVSSAKVNAGDVLADNVTGRAATGEQWVRVGGSYVPVRVDVDVYGPLAQKPTQGTVPAGAPFLGTGHATLTGPGATVKVTTNAVASTQGWYTFVAKIVKAKQDTIWQPYIKGNFTDAYGIPNETSFNDQEIDISTQIGSPVVTKGQSITDAVTLTDNTGSLSNLWLLDPSGNPIRVPMKVELFGPFDVSQAHGVALPVGATPVATDTFVATRYGTFDVDFDGYRFDKSGFYFSRASVDTANLNAVAREYLDDDTETRTDGNWAPGELVEVLQQYDLSSDIPTAGENVSKGTRFSDTVTVSPTNAGDKWIAPGGTRIQLPLKVETFGPFADKGAPGDALPAGTTPVAVTKLTVNDYGTYTVPFAADAVAEFSGYYFHRVSVDTEALNATAKAHLDDQYEAPVNVAVSGPGTDGNWAPNETATVRMAPQVVTERQERIIDEKDLPKALVDQVTVSLKDAGDKWLNVNGNPVPITVVNDAYGPYDTPQAQVADPSAGDAAKKIGSETVVFTEPGTKSTPGETIIQAQEATPRSGQPAPADTPTGFYTWESKVAAATMYDAFDSDFWVENETATVRDQITHYSRSYEPDLTPGGQIIDDVIIGQFRASHGEFEGLDGTQWGADNKLARVVVYGPLTGEPDDSQATVPDGTPTFDIVEIPAKASALYDPVSGAFEIGYDELNVKRVPLTVPEELKTPGQCKGTVSAWYQFVYEFDGDDRTTPFTSDFNDHRERATVMWEYDDCGVEPRIDVEKTDTDFVPHGNGGWVIEGGVQSTDADNNRPNDRDSVSTAAQVTPGTETEIFFQVTNNGGEPLTDIRITDRTMTSDDLPGKVSDVDVAIDWAQNGERAYWVDEDGYVMTTTAGGEDVRYVLAVGSSISFTGTLPGLKAGELHGNTVEVVAVGVESGTPTGDNDNYHAEGTYTPSIDIEKSSDGFPNAGEGNYGDEDDNIAYGVVELDSCLTPGGDGVPVCTRSVSVADADTKDTAVALVAGTDTPIYFRVTNNGDEPLVNVVVDDVTIIGGRTVDIIWEAIPEVFEPGDSFTGVGVLPGLDIDEFHGDEASVTASGQFTGTRVGDDDQWHGYTVNPRIDIEKTDTDFVTPGQGMYEDADNNRGGTDRDTFESRATVSPGQETEIYFRVTNTGNEPLTDIRVIDTTLTDLPALPGTTVSEKAVDIKWDFEVDEDGYVLTTNKDGEKVRLVLPVGNSFSGIGVLPGLAAGDLHGDNVEVTARGVITGSPVGDDDQWHAEAEYTPAIDIEKSSDGFPNAGEGNYGDADDNITTGTLPVEVEAVEEAEIDEVEVKDADTAETAVALEPKTPTTIYFRVTNTGDEPLTNITVDDVTTVGNRDVDVTWAYSANEDGFLVTDVLDEDGMPVIDEDGNAVKELLVLLPGESFTGQGELPGLNVRDLHANTATVTGEGVRSGKEVGDDDEWNAYVPFEPEVSTAARPIAKPGDVVTDIIRVGGLVPDEGLVVISEAFVQDTHQPVCSAADFTSKPIPVKGVGDYETDGFKVTEVGKVMWVEKLIDLGEDGKYGTDDDVVLHEGKCGAPGETTHIIDVSTLVGHKDTNQDGILGSGDTYFDNIIITGSIPAGAKVEAESTAYAVPFASVKYVEPIVETVKGAQIEKVIDKDWTEIGTYKVADEITAVGTHKTEGFVLTEDQFADLGAMTWVETVTVTVEDAFGNEHVTTVTGERGDLDETIGPLHYGAKSVSSGGGGQKVGTGITGSETLVLVALSALLVTAGAAVTVVARKRGLNQD